MDRQIQCQSTQREARDLPPACRSSAEPPEARGSRSPSPAGGGGRLPLRAGRFYDSPSGGKGLSVVRRREELPHGEEDLTRGGIRGRFQEPEIGNLADFV